MYFRKLWIMLGILYIGLILLGSFSKIPDINSQFNGTDKIIHFVSYFILVSWFAQIYEKKWHWLILIAGILLGLLIEVLQDMTIYRQFDALDGIANSIGAVGAFLLAKTSFSSGLLKLDHWIVQKMT